MRRFVVCTFAVLAVGVWAPASDAGIPKPSVPIDVWNTGTGNGCYLYTADLRRKGPLGSLVEFENQTSKAHDVSDRAGTFGVRVKPGATKSVTMHGAGTYVATCDGRNPNDVFGMFVAAPSRPASSSFAVTWADTNAGSRWRYDVRYRVASGAWKDWKHNTAVRAHGFSGSAGHTYFFEARTTGPDGTTRWSPPRKVVT
jgi:hypothetical protein